VDNRKQGRRTDLEQVAQEIQKGRSARDLAMEFPVVFMKYPTGMMKTMELIAPRAVKKGFEMKDFKAKPINWDDVADDTGDHLNMIIWGPAGTGKTEWAKAHFKNPFVCRGLEELRTFDKEEFDGIVFDDMNFVDLPRTMQLALLDNQATSIGARYSDIVNTWGDTKKFFTTNVHDGECFDLDDAAIMRRIAVIHVPEKLFAHVPKRRRVFQLEYNDGEEPLPAVDNLCWCDGCVNGTGCTANGGFVVPPLPRVERAPRVVFELE